MTQPRRGRPGYDREQILEGAVEVFIEQGYDAASVATLAARLGLTKSALYHHFSSKEAVLEAALDTALQALDGVLARPDVREGPPLERLTAAIRATTQALVDNLPSVTLLLRVRGNSPTEVAALQHRRAFDDAVTAVVREAQQEGAVRAELDPALTTRLLVGMVNSLTEWYRPGSRSSAAVVDAVAAIALDGLRPR